MCVNGDDGADVFKTENESQEERTSLGLMLIKGRWRHTGVSAPPDPPGSGYCTEVKVAGHKTWTIYSFLRGKKMNH